MTAQTLPDNPNFYFVPTYDVEDEVQQIRIVIEGMAGHVPTALVALTIEDALSICDKLNRRLGYDRHGGRLNARRGRRPGRRRLALKPSLCCTAGPLDRHTDSRPGTLAKSHSSRDAPRVSGREFSVVIRYVAQRPKGAQA